MTSKVHFAAAMDAARPAQRSFSGIEGSSPDLPSSMALTRA
jgi:hypothetical protein